MLEIDSDAKILFYEHAGILSIGSNFRDPKKRDEIWVDFVNILCVVSVPTETNDKKNWKVCARKFDGKIFCVEEYTLSSKIFDVILFICKPITSLEVEICVMSYSHFF